MTLVLPRTAKIPPVVSAGLDTVAVRIPSHPVALRLIELSGLPLAAPSANLSGRPSPTTAAHVLADLDGRIRAIVDGGETGWGVESTVVDCTAPLPAFAPWRGYPGGAADGNARGSGSWCLRSAAAGKSASIPGMKYRHYSPNAKVVLVLEIGQKSGFSLKARSMRHRGGGLGLWHPRSTALATASSPPCPWDR